MQVSRSNGYAASNLSLDRRKRLVEIATNEISRRVIL
jgi:hypothetical protein